MPDTIMPRIIPERALEKLSVGQIECLYLVNQHLTSKEIALRLGVSPHTVDQRLRGALKVLGVEKRSEAARILVKCKSEEGFFQHEPPVDEPFVERFAPKKLSPSMQLPFATKAYPENRMSVFQRVMWILAIGFGAAFSAGFYLAGLESLARMLNNYS